MSLKNNILTFKNEIADGFTDDIWQQWLGVRNQNELSEATYFTCLKILSETMGKLPLKLYKDTDKGREKVVGDNRSFILGTRPNKFMTASTFWSTCEMNCQHYGNSFVWLRYEYVKDKKAKGHYELHDMWLMPSSDVTILIDNSGIFGNTGEIYYRYTDRYTGKQYVFKSQDVLHFKTWMSWDGIRGLSVREILGATTIASLQASSEFVKTQNERGLSAGLALQYTSDFDDKHVEAVQNKYEKYLSGPKNAGRIVPVPVGLTLTPLKMTASDAQFYELRKYTALQIGAAFGIKPNQLNDYEKSSYSNSETQQIAFLVDTASGRLKMYEEEVDYKILTKVERNENRYYWKHNEKALLRTDAKTQTEVLAQQVLAGITMPNEAREKLDQPKAEGGDVLIVNGSCVPLNNMQQKGGDNK